MADRAGPKGALAGHLEELGPLLGYREPAPPARMPPAPAAAKPKSKPEARPDAEPYDLMVWALFPWFY